MYALKKQTVATPKVGCKYFNCVKLLQCKYSTHINVLDPCQMQVQERPSTV